jgi:hypothetical protein
MSVATHALALSTAARNTSQGTLRAEPVERVAEPLDRVHGGIANDGGEQLSRPGYLAGLVIRHGLVELLEQVSQLSELAPMGISCRPC